MTCRGRRCIKAPETDGDPRERRTSAREATHERTRTIDPGQLVHDKVMYLPIWQLTLLQGHGPRVAESGLGLIADYPWSAPYEDVKLK